MNARAATSRLIDDILSGLPEGERRSLAEAVLGRTLPLLRRLVQTATADELKESLTAATDVGTLSRLLTDAAVQAEVKALDPLAEAFARGAEAKEDLLRRAGGAWTADEVAAHLHISRQAVNKRRKAGTLLAVEAGTNYLYPRCQFTEAGVLEHLPEVLRAMDTESGWMKLQLLFTHTLRTAPERAGEPPETILEALQRGRVEDALHAARTWGTQGAA